MRLTFLGTRGGIESRSRRHRQHSTLLIEHGGRRVLIDCGDDWLGELDALAPDAILVTHAHPDHAGGLAEGAPCAVYASATTCRALPGTVDTHAIRLGSRISIARLAVEAFPVVHSRIAPAVGYRIAGRVVYVPDVVDLRDKTIALHGIELYIGDGARLTRPLVRTTATGRRFGHTSIAKQLGWCARAGIPRAIFTHCGTEVVRDHAAAAKVVRALGQRLGLDASLAHDGLVVDL
jgi:phosphoribosyl 1,2-cyclic phosphodiesterase